MRFLKLCPATAFTVLSLVPLIDWGLRDYGVVGQIGLEKTPELYVSRMVEVFREVRRVLRKDGTLWLNLGDSYSSGGHGGGGSFMEMRGGNGSLEEGAWAHRKDAKGWRNPPPGLKTKDLVGIPWMLAFALRADGWYLRQDIIWAKPNPMPESVTDRCTKAHEYLFLLSKSSRYFYDQEAIAEPLALSSYARLGQEIEQQEGSPVPFKTNGNMNAVRPRFGGKKYGDNPAEEFRTKSGNGYLPRKRDETPRNDGERWNENNGRGFCTGTEFRNRRSVWDIATQPFPEAHFATFPPKLIEPCILAGCPEGGTVLDPFAGAGTTGLVATRFQRNFIGIELNPAYVKMAEKRIIEDQPLFNQEIGALGNEG